MINKNNFKKLRLSDVIKRLSEHIKEYGDQEVHDYSYRTVEGYFGYKNHVKFDKWCQARSDKVYFATQYRTPFDS